jgi:hypothetical protein
MIKNLLLFGFVFAGLVVAQPTAPVFTLSSTDAASLAGYTNVDPLNVNVTSYQGSPIGWCIHLSTGFTTYCQNSGNWTHAVPTAFTLPSGSADGPYTVDLVYKTTAVSTIGSASIILDTTAPSVTLYSPSGVTGWSQTLSNANAQYVTGAISDANPVTFSLAACTSASSCSTFQSSETASVPFVWDWPAASISTSDTLVQITATDAAGNQTQVQSSPAFTVFNPATAPYSLTCGTSACPTLSISGDPQSSSSCPPCFTGYADPSMRRDPVVGSSNANGTNLWMLYSWPETITTSTEVVEIHLASSSDGGNSWTYNSTIWPSTYNSTTNQYSSHKVANFWPYTNGNWYAVHLEYFVTPGNTIAYSVPDGNLVTTVATSPANLATATSQNLYYSTLNTLVLDATGVTTACQGGYNIHGSPQGSWGEPAITVQSGTAYLITMCVSPNFTNSQYYVFSSTDLTNLAPSNWAYYGGPFDLATFSSASAANATLLGTPYYSSATFLTEFDVAQRADNTLVAVITPAYINGSGVEVQDGCIAVPFTLASGSSQPFGTYVATLTDYYSDGSGSDKIDGPNACTYEPTSLTGMLIVRRLLATGTFLVSMLDSGIMP